MGYYCTGPNHVNDHVDAAIMARDTVRNSTSWESLSHPRHAAQKENPWETTVDLKGRGVAGQEAMDRWAEEKPISKYVLRRSEGGLAEPLIGKYRVANSDVQVPLNKIGEYLSRNANLEHLLKETLFDEVHGLNPLTVAWIKFLADRGYDDGPDIVAIGTENMSAEARIWYRAAITGSKHLGKWAEAHAEELGIDNYRGRLAYKISVMLHELGHNRGVGSEYKLGMLMKEFYARMTKKCKGTDDEKIYEALAKEAEEYAESKRASRFSKYLALYKRSRDNDGLSAAGIRALILEYEAEGRAEGYEGKELMDYVAKRLEDADEKDHDSGKEEKDNEDKEEPDEDSPEAEEKGAPDEADDGDAEE